MSTVSTADIASLLAQMLEGEAGGSQARWLELIGPVKVLPIAVHRHCNWSIDPIATGEELRAIRAAEERLRIRHPYVS